MAEFYSNDKFAKSIPHDAGEELVEWMKWIMDIVEKQQQQIYARITYTRFRM